MLTVCCQLWRRAYRSSAGREQRCVSSLAVTSLPVVKTMHVIGAIDSFSFQPIMIRTQPGTLSLQTLTKLRLYPEGAVPCQTAPTPTNPY